MRKAITTAFAVSLILVAAACGDDDDGGAAEGEESIRVTLIQGLAGEEFYETMRCGAQEKADELGVELDVQGPERFDPTLQTPIVNSVVADQPDAILIAPTHVDSMIAPLRQAEEAEIKVILVDTVVSDEEIGESRISTDNEGAGGDAATALAEQIGDQGKVLVISTDPGVSTVDARIKGFEDEIAANHPNVEYIGVQYSHNDVAEASRIVNAELARTPDLVGVFATNLNSATGAGSALQQAGLLGQVKMIGFDAGPAQVEQLRAGVVQALIAQLPGDIGAQGVEQAVASVRGESVTAEIPTDATIVTADNVDDPEVQAVLYEASC